MSQNQFGLGSKALKKELLNIPCGPLSTNILSNLQPLSAALDTAPIKKAFNILSYKGSLVPKKSVATESIFAG